MSVASLQYKKRYCQLLVKHLSQGYSFESFGAVANTHRKVLYDWVHKYPEFAEAKQRGTEQGLRLFEKLLISQTMGKKITDKDGTKLKPNLGAICFMLKTRFHKVYSEKQHLEVSTPKDQSIKIDFVRPPEKKQETPAIELDQAVETESGDIILPAGINPKIL